MTIPSIRRRLQAWRAIYSRDSLRWGMLPSLTAHLALDTLYTCASTENRRIMDVGCGYGRDLLLFSSLFPYADLHGIDVAVPAVRKAQSLLPRATIIRADLLKLPPSPQFDVVFSNYFVHLFVDDEIDSVLNAMAALVAPGGALVSSFVSRRDRHFGTGVPLNASRTAYEVYPGVPWTFFARPQISGLVKGCGFNVTTLHHFQEIELVDGHADAVSAFFLIAKRND